MKAVAVLGPTGSGKSEVALRVAERIGGEILSVDSMQVYRGMDVGTAKPTAVEREAVSHHLIDLVDPEAEFTVADFQYAAHGVLGSLDQEIMPVIVGGSGLHFRAIVDPMTFAPSDPAIREAVEGADPRELVDELLAVDPAAAEHVDLRNPRRVVRAVEILRISGSTPSERAEDPEAEAVRRYEPRLPFVAIGLDPGHEIVGRVTRRFDRMLERGLLDEVRSLAPRLGRTARQAVGYKELLPLISGETSIHDARMEAIRATLALAKRQRTFFRRDPRIVWLPWDERPEARFQAVWDVIEREPACTS